MSIDHPPIRCVRRRPVAVLPFVAGLACIMSGGCGADAGGYQTWWEIGAVQMLEGPDEAWIFVEADREVFRPGRFTEPPVIALGRTQRVVVLDADGVKQSFDCKEAKLSFNANISRVFRWNDRFYCLENASKNRPLCVWCWTAEGFALLQQSESDPILSAIGVADVTSSELPGLLDNVTEENGWHMVCAENPPITAAISKVTLRSGIAFALEVHGAVQALVATRPPAKHITLISADTTREELSDADHEALWQELE